jgi:hypothetical protein
MSRWEVGGSREGKWVGEEVMRKIMQEASRTARKMWCGVWRRKLWEAWRARERWMMDWAVE